MPQDNTFILLLVLYLVLLIGVALYFVALVNRRNQAKISTLRNDWTNKLHQDIGGDLSSVKLRLGILEKKLENSPDHIKEDLRKAYGILEGVQQKFRYVFDLIDNQKNTFQVITEDLIHFAKENLKLAEIEFHFQNQLPEKLKFEPDIVRVNKFYLAAKEIIHNCVKYSKAHNFHLCIEQTKTGIRFESRDDGIGFSTSQQHAGSGMKNLRQYAEEGSLDIRIRSGDGKGTHVTIILLY